MAQLSGAPGSASEPRSIRVAGEADIPFILQVAFSAYGFDNPEIITSWLRKALKEPNCRVLVGGHSVGVGYAFQTFYWKKPRGHILHVASIPKGMSTEALRLMRSLVEWLKEKGCFEVTFGSEIGVDYAPFAARLGAVRAAPSYVIRFDQEPEYA